MQNDSDPLISVIVPCYNYGHLLLETLENLREQSYTNWECIIVDDGSTDSSADVAKSILNADNRFQYIYQKNAGLSAARNTGIKHSKGAFIQLLDADDFIESEKFKNQLAQFQNDSSIGIVYSEVRYFSSEDHQLRRFTITGDDLPWMSFVDSKTPDLLLEKLVHSNLFVVNAPLIRREIIDQIGEFNVVLRSVEDWEYWCRCAFNKVCFHFDSGSGSMALVRIHSNSMSRSSKRMMEASLIVRKLLVKLIQNQGLGSNTLFELNRSEQAYLHRSLYEIYRTEKKWFPAFKNLIQFGKIKKEFRFVAKEIVRFNS